MLGTPRENVVLSLPFHQLQEVLSWATGNISAITLPQLRNSVKLVNASFNLDVS
jgi:hypothetical protein